MVLQEISEDGIRVLTRPLEATFTFTLLTQCPVKKWHFDKSESKSLRKQSWPNLMFLKIRDAISQQKCIFLNILLGLVSKHESEDRNSRSRLEAWDRREEILDLVSKHETEGKKFSISSRSMRLKGRNSRSRLESWNWHLAMLWCVMLIKVCTFTHSFRFYTVCDFTIWPHWKITHSVKLQTEGGG